ncbi:GTP-binding protein [Methanosarcinaceae archaeon]|nr:GTP-binding protein [Methanosarcinaceae archaeon]
MKILIIGGFLGSGKTTMITGIGKYCASLGNRICIIVNEIGEIGIDGDIISRYGLETKEITSGCICCSLKMSLRSAVRTIYDGFRPDILLIEPTGIAFPGAVKKEIELMNLPDDCIVLPLVTLFDGSRFKQIMKEIRHFASGQICDAEIIAVSKADLVDPVMIPVIRESLRQMNPKAEIVTVSAGNEQSMIDLLHLANVISSCVSEGRSSSGSVTPAEISSSASVTPVEISSSASVTPAVKIMPAADSGPSSENPDICYFSLAYGPERQENPEDPVFPGDEEAGLIVKDIMKRIRDRLVSFNPDFVGHVKLSFDTEDKTFCINLTSGDQEPVISVTDAGNRKPGFKVFAAVSGVRREDIETAVRESVRDGFENVFRNHFRKVFPDDRRD